MDRPGADGDLGSLLAVFAHPDDEAYLVGGLMAEAHDAGRPVTCVTATRGELGFAEDDPRPLDERAALRTAELRACLEVLGVSDHRFLEYPDGGCHTVGDDEAADRLAAVIDELRPDTLATFGPDGQTYHPDHMAVSRWATLACRRAAHRPRLLYAVMTPGWVAEFTQVVPAEAVMMVDGAQPPTVADDEVDVWYVAEGHVLDRKVRALRCQASQVESIVALGGVDAFARLVADETFRESTPADWPD